jgi:phosphatidylinositol alpha-1,6-mannosyltransferase
MSPGINALDADVVGVHILFEQILASRAHDPDSLARRLHRIVYHRLLARLERRVYSGPGELWAVSRKDAREIESRFDRPPGSVPAIPHGVDTDRFSPLWREELRGRRRAMLGVDEERVLLVVANDIVKKGVDRALGALRALPSDTVLAVVGDLAGPTVARLAAEASVAKRVRFVGPVDDIRPYYAAADLLLAPSRDEAFNLPVIESLASGLPVVVSESAGVSDYVASPATIVVTDPDDIGSLADAVRETFSRIEDDPSIHEHAREAARTMSWQESAERAAEVVRREASTPRVLVLATGAGRVGGIERVTRTLAQALGDSFGEERVGVLSIWRGDQAVAGRVLTRGDPMTTDGRVGQPRSARFAFDAVRFARRWRRRLAIVAAHPHLAPVGWLAHVVSGAPYAVWCHGIEVWGPIERATRFGITRADRVFAPSRFTAAQAERWAGLAKGSVVVLPHAVPPGLDAVPKEEESREPGSVLTVARLELDHSYKGIDTLLEAWPTVLEVVPQATLTVVGDGADRARLERRATELGIAAAITFAGRLSDDRLAREYATATLFALPGRFRTGTNAQGEGFGLVFIEAGAAGLPVVAGKGGGADDAVEHDVSGLLVDPHDSGAVAGAIVGVLTNPELARRLGEGGRQLAETRFSYEAFRAGVVELVEGLPIRGLVR